MQLSTPLRPRFHRGVDTAAGQVLNTLMPERPGLLRRPRGDVSRQLRRHRLDPMPAPPADLAPLIQKARTRSPSFAIFPVAGPSPYKVFALLMPIMMLKLRPPAKSGLGSACSGRVRWRLCPAGTGDKLRGSALGDTANVNYSSTKPQKDRRETAAEPLKSRCRTANKARGHIK